jgi:hypothetical protein
MIEHRDRAVRWSLHIVVLLALAHCAVPHAADAEIRLIPIASKVAILDAVDGYHSEVILDGVQAIGRAGLILRGNEYDHRRFGWIRRDERRNDGDAAYGFIRQSAIVISEPCVRFFRRTFAVEDGSCRRYMGSGRFAVVGLCQRDCRHWITIAHVSGAGDEQVWSLLGGELRTREVDLEDVQEGYEDNEAQRYDLYDKARILAGLCLLTGGFVFLYKFGWKVRFDITRHSNVARDAAILIGTCCVVGMGMWMVLMPIFSHI